MTGRATAIVAGASLAVGLGAVAARPFLPDHPRATSDSRTLPSLAAPAAVGLAAERTADQDLRCPAQAATRRGAGCGQLWVSRRQVTCPTSTRCQVELVGGLDTAQLTVPVALTVTVTRSAAGWRAVEVTS